MKVLDVGCGWGGLAMYLHRHYDVDVLGVALAPTRSNFPTRRGRRRRRRPVKFELKDYRDVEGNSTGSPASA